MQTKRACASHASLLNTTTEQWSDRAVCEVWASVLEVFKLKFLVPEFGLPRFLVPVLFVLYWHANLMLCYGIHFHQGRRSS